MLRAGATYGHPCASIQPDAHRDGTNCYERASNRYRHIGTADANGNGMHDSGFEQLQ